MLKFKEIYEQKSKTYSFKIGVAGDIPENFANTLETALKRFDVVNLSKTKTTPIQERPLDFPQHQNVQVHFFETEIRYPTTPQIMREYVAQTCGVSAANVIVRYPDEPIEQYQEQTENKPYEALLDTPLEGESAQQSVAGNRVMELLKELEKARAEREHDPGAAAPQTKENRMSDSSDTISPLGSKK